MCQVAISSFRIVSTAISVSVSLDTVALTVTKKWTNVLHVLACMECVRYKFYYTEADTVMPAIGTITFTLNFWVSSVVL